MKNLLAILALCFLTFGCTEVTSEAPEPLKKEVINNKSIDGPTANYDLKCSVCGKTCCSNCTSNGDRNSCSKTRFKECSNCKHGKSSHYASRR